MKMKKSALTLAVFLTLAALAFGAVQISVSGIGVGFASDQATADQSADQQASSNMQMYCAAGVIVSSFKSGDQCANLGDDNNPNYMCTVSYLGTCRVGR
jgi:hydrogenase maturation factor